MFFADIHTHILYGTDDGAKTPEDMFAMVKVAYEQGTRLICLTSHFFPFYFGDNSKEAKQAFDVLTEYCSQNYPDLELVFGNELGYKHDSLVWLKNGLCNPIGDTNYLLVEFLTTDNEDQIAEGVYRLQSLGYIPIIAHAERYKKLSLERVWALRQNGVLIQINADSILKSKGLFADKKVVKLIKKGYVDFVATDAHDLKSRTPKLKESYEAFVQSFGKEYAAKVYYKNALNLFSKKGEGK